MRTIVKLFMICALLSSKAYALNCYITLVKAACWKNFDVSVNVTDAESGKNLGDITVYQGDSWGRNKISCEPGMTLAMGAKFSPAFWESDDGREFKATRFWKLPEKSSENAIGWNVTVCYPKWFADIPTPPDAGGDCQCDMGEVKEFSADDV